ncbi:MAG TPA: response regulator [Candidatus Angelobacter sp.]|nr:response regulator [Candidatus Angelobacter sp.]
MRPKRTILCVDDNEQALSIRKVMLETRGYRVLVSTDGPRALEIFKNGGIDLVISDFMMPGYNGATLITNMKEVSPETPAILFSGRVKFCDQEHKADLFVPKGTCAPAELLERIRVLLVKKRGPKKASLVSANIRHTAS